MGIFNLKRVKELERELEKTKRERDDYRSVVEVLEAKFEEMGRLQESVPKDCEKGPWCESCTFVRTFHHRQYSAYFRSIEETAYICGKGASCPNYVQRGN